MTSPRQAQITWLSEGEGGRKAPPTGYKYITIAQFGDNPPAWSLIVESVEPLDTARHILANVRFLVDEEEAPFHLLLPGNRFKLLEGRRVVAIGSIVPEREANSVSEVAPTLTGD